jgi:hypothetical protein
MGVQFADILTKVNTFYLWVDRQLTPEVAASFHFDAYTSDDNIRWTSIPVAGVLFGAFQNRFEITIPTTAARYLKIVTKPLDPAVTVDRRFTNILVTELQVLLITPLTGTTAGWQASTREVLNASGRTPLGPAGLFYDVNGIVSHSTATGTPTLNTWLLTNGLSYGRRLSQIFVFNARVARQDDDQSFGHEGLFLYSASLVATPLATLSHSLIYSGQSVWNQQGFGSTNSVSFYNRATPYRGIGLLAGGAYSIITQGSGLVLRSGSVTFNASVQPHSTLTLSTTLGHAESVSSGGGQPRTVSITDRIDAGAVYNPVSALYVAGGYSRIITDSTPHTLANGSVTFSPFPGGNLQLSLNYSETYQDPGETTRLFTPALRWNVRPGTMITTSYTLLDSSSGSTSANHTRTFDANFQTAL